MTVIEIVIALAVLATLLAIFLPSVGVVRESSRRASCTSRLSGLGKALSSFESQRHRLPGHSWRLNLLPHIDQGVLWKKAKDSQTWGDAEVFYRNAQIEVFLCPSSGAPEGPGGVWAADYVGCYAGSPFGSGLGYATAGRENGMFPVDEDPPQAGAIPTGRRHPGRRLSEVVDGLSQTSMVSEVRHSNDSSGRLRVVWFLPPAETSSVDDIAAQCDQLPSQPAAHGFLGDQSGLGVPWYLGDWGHGLYNHVLTPNRPSCHPDRLGNRVSIYTAASMHPGGVSHLWGDSRTDFVNENIDLDVWRRMGRIDDVRQPD